MLHLLQYVQREVLRQADTCAGICPQLSRHLPGRTAFFFLFYVKRESRKLGKEERETALRASGGQGGGAELHRETRSPALDPPRSPALGVGCLRRCAWRPSCTLCLLAALTRSTKGGEEARSCGQVAPSHIPEVCAWSPNSLQGSRACPPIRLKESSSSSHEGFSSPSCQGCKSQLPLHRTAYSIMFPHTRCRMCSHEQDSSHRQAMGLHLPPLAASRPHRPTAGGRPPDR